MLKTADDIRVLNERISHAGQFTDKLRNEIAHVIVGQSHMLDRLLIGLLSNGHVLLEGVPGLAKTLTIKSLAQAIHAKFSRIQFTPDLLPADVIGTMIYNQQRNEFVVRRGPIFANFILADEINRAPAKTQSALLEIMEERQATIDGRTYPMAVPFMVIATQNPIEQEGTYRLPEAQLDRFLFKILVPYPSEAEELTILSQFHNMGNVQPLDIIKPVLSGQMIALLRQQIKTLIIDEKLMQFIAKLIQQTRNHKSIYLGASPRASLAIMNASKAMAAVHGRDFVTPEDILEMVTPILRHRIILSPDKEMEGITEDEVIKQIIQGMDVPR